jgi:hypothetical protein
MSERKRCARGPHHGRRPPEAPPQEGMPSGGPWTGEQNLPTAVPSADADDDRAMLPRDWLVFDARRVLGHRRGPPRAVMSMAAVERHGHSDPGICICAECMAAATHPTATTAYCASKAGKIAGAGSSRKFPFWRSSGDHPLSRHAIEQTASYRRSSATEPVTGL